MNEGKASKMTSSIARENFREVITRVEEHGETITLTRHSRPCAVVVPPSWYERATTLMAQEQGHTA